MTEEELIKKLRQLKMLEPSQQTLLAMEKKIFSRIRPTALNQKDGRRAILNSPAAKSAVRAAAIALAVVLLILAAGTKDIIFQRSQDLYIQTRIALASSQYKKSQLAIQFAKARLASFKQAKTGKINTQLEELSRSVSFADKTMGSLKLSGEPGKYTKQQCLAAYQEYYSYLGELGDAVNEKASSAQDPAIHNQLEGFRSQIRQYKENASVKLWEY